MSETTRNTRKRLSWFNGPVIGLFVAVLVPTSFAYWLDSSDAAHDPGSRDHARREIDVLPWHPVQGQRLYVPAYSHVYHRKGDPHYLTVTLSIRNTDVDDEVVVTSVRYFDTAGEELRSMLRKPLKLSPMAATEFVIARNDKAGGSGASFLVEWKAGAKVTPPIVETVNIDTGSSQGLSFVAPAIALEESGPFDPEPEAGD